MKKLRRKRNRLNGYDYSREGYYFVTICVKGTRKCLGEVRDGEMVLNQWGKIVQNQWLWLADQYQYVELDEFVVMPNHFHGIVIIDGVAGRAKDNEVGTALELSLQDGHEDRDMQKILSLSNIVGAFKTTSSKIIHQNGYPEFLWQRSFYDHIIRDDYDLCFAQEYIRNNPLRGNYDEYDLYA